MQKLSSWGYNMERKLKTYQIHLKVNGPVFVGDGNEIQKKEYMFLNRNTIGVIDGAKFYMLAKKLHLQNDFERFMIDDTREDLKHWCLRNHVSQNDLKNCMKYVENVGDRSEEKGKLQVMTCITDPYGNPYIPGSSLKGMLRTILLSRDILQNREKYRTDTRQLSSDLEVNRINRRILNNNIVKIEKNAFNSVRSSGKETVDFDIMSGIIVGDSEPLSREDIILCQKWEQHTDGTYKTLNLLRECIKPGTVIKSTLTIDETLCNIKKEDILEAVQLFYEQYYQNFQKKFSRSDRRKPNTVFLGGGSGFVSKTVIYPLFGEKEGIETVKNIFDRTNVPKTHQHYKDTRIGVSPHILKCTRYQGKEYMMGECELNII